MHQAVEAYLRRFGYLIGSTTSGLSAAVAAFRSVFGLPPGEDVDESVLRAMAWPRCGLPDHRLVTAESRWRKRTLTYHVAGYVPGLSRQDQEDLIALAWRDWIAVADLTASRAANAASADIVIGTGRGPGQGFDGPAGTLAWAQLPKGDDRQLMMRFDVDELWVRSGSDRGILFRNVACHEIGHLLGLDHSSVRTALMAPYYAPGVAAPQANDDVVQIRALYGPPQTPTAPAGRRLVLDFDGPIPTFTVRRE